MGCAVGVKYTGFWRICTKGKKNGKYLNDFYIDYVLKF